jgi:hypothetical protein
MGLFDLLNKGKGKANAEGELRQLMFQVKEVVAEMVEIMGDMPPTIREGSRRSYSEAVGESPEETMKRLTKMERRLLAGSLESVPRSELSSLKDRMKRLDAHLTNSYQEAKKLPEGRAGRKAVRSSVKERSRMVDALIDGLENAMR